MRHPGHGSLPPLPDGLQDEVLGRGGVVGADPVALANQEGLLLRGDVLGPGFSNEQLRKLPERKRLLRMEK